MVYSIHSVPCESELLPRIIRSWKPKWMLCLQTFHYYSFLTSWAMRNSWRTTFRTSYRQNIVVGQCSSLVSIDTFISVGIRNQSYLPSRKLSNCIVTSSIRRPRNYAKLWNVQDRTKLTKELDKSWKNCQRVWNLPNFIAPPQRFQVSLPPSDIVFNREMAL